MNIPVKNAVLGTALNFLNIGNAHFARAEYVDAATFYIRALRNNSTTHRSLIANLALTVHRHLASTRSCKRLAIICDGLSTASLQRAVEIAAVHANDTMVDVLLIQNDDLVPKTLRLPPNCIVRLIPLAEQNYDYVEHAAKQYYESVWVVGTSHGTQILSGAAKTIWGSEIVLDRSGSATHTDDRSLECLAALEALRREWKFLLPHAAEATPAPPRSNDQLPATDELRSQWKAPFYKWKNESLPNLEVTAPTVAQANLRTFGASFLGPVVAAFFNALSQRLGNSSEHATLNFVAREGFFLQRIYQRLVSEGLIRDLPSRYLFCSRTLLFKLALSVPKLWPRVMQHHYNGRLIDFFGDRFSLTEEDAWRVLQKSPTFSRDPSVRIALPGDKALVESVMEEIRSDIISLGEERTEIYLDYLRQVGFGSQREHIVDLGYAGTIQTMLSAITNVKTEGHYCITTKKAKNTRLCKFTGYLLDGVDFGEGYPLLDRSLYLESILTAPHGSVIDVLSTEGGIAFLFGKETNAQEKFGDLSHIVAGAVEYAVQALKLGFVMSSDELNQYYGRFVSNLSNFPACVFDIFEIDDAISGHGVLNPLKFFHLGNQ